MAQRRMFSLKIVDSDAFLDMPQSSQLLYFHLSMRADDDGFVGNPKKIMRMVGSGNDDYKVLVTKRFILQFQTGVVVIKHWKIHNYIQSDRHNPTQYIEEMQGIITKENGSYTECIQNVSSLDSQVRLGKVRLGKESSAFGQFKNVQLTDDEYSNLVEALGEGPLGALIEELSGYIESTGKKYKSHYATIQNWARRKIQEHATKVMGAKPKSI